MNTSCLVLGVRELCEGQEEAHTTRRHRPPRDREMWLAKRNNLFSGWWGQGPIYVFTDFCGVNISTMASFKLPTVCPWAGRGAHHGPSQASTRQLPHATMETCTHLHAAAQEAQDLGWGSSPMPGTELQALMPSL